MTNIECGKDGISVDVLDNVKIWNIFEQDKISLEGINVEELKNLSCCGECLERSSYKPAEKSLNKKFTFDQLKGFLSLTANVLEFMRLSTKDKKGSVSNHLIAGKPPLKAYFEEDVTIRSLSVYYSCELSSNEDKFYFIARALVDEDRRVRGMVAYAMPCLNLENKDKEHALYLFAMKDTYFLNRAAVIDVFPYMRYFKEGIRILTIGMNDEDPFVCSRALDKVELLASSPKDAFDILMIGIKNKDVGVRFKVLRKIGYAGYLHGRKILEIAVYDKDPGVRKYAKELLEKF